MAVFASHVNNSSPVPSPTKKSRQYLPVPEQEPTGIKIAVFHVNTLKELKKGIFFRVAGHACKRIVKRGILDDN
jgi:hypothetical protein